MTKTQSATTLTPLADRVLVRRVEADEKTKGGIILPDTAKEKPKEGIVISVVHSEEIHRLQKILLRYYRRLLVQNQPI